MELLAYKAFTHAASAGGESIGFQNGTEFTVIIGSWVQYFSWGILGNDERQCVFNCEAWEDSFFFFPSKWSFVQSCASSAQLSCTNSLKNQWKPEGYLEYFKYSLKEMLRTMNII